MGKKKKKEEEVLLKANTTRKYYLPFYVMTVILAGFLMYLDIKGVTVSWISIMGFFVFFFFGLNFTEVHRMNSAFKITPDHISCTYGIFNKNIKKIDYFAISDVYKKQNFWQWMLCYGDVQISLFSEDEATRIRNINRPSRFVEFLDEMMKKSRSKSKSR